MVWVLYDHMITVYWDELAIPSHLTVLCTWQDKAKSFNFFFSVGKLMELHGEGGATAAKATGDETGAKVERADGYEPPIQETV